MTTSRSIARATALVLLVAGSAAAAFGCSDTAGKKATPAPGTTDGGVEGTDGGEETFTSGSELRISVPESGRVYVKLGEPSAIVTPADPKTDKGWDVAFEGLDVFTNSGPSGGGGSSAFGPLAPIVFLEDVAPAVPFLAPDSAGGAFLRWYIYGGEPEHALYTRLHVYGIKDGAKYYKLQVLNYYGVLNGAPTAAYYRVRWAEVTPQGTGAVQELSDIDGIAGGPQGTPQDKSECLDLGTGARMKLTPAEARVSSAWHVCFRRQDISVNGEVGGPRAVGAVDLDAEKSATETLDDVFGKTDAADKAIADRVKARFDAIDSTLLAAQIYRGDRVVSAFGTLWLESGANPPAPSKNAWLVVGADSKSKYLLGFPRFEGATAASPGTIVMRVKAVQ